MLDCDGPCKFSRIFCIALPTIFVLLVWRREDLTYLLFCNFPFNTCSSNYYFSDFCNCKAVSKIDYLEEKFAQMSNKRMKKIVISSLARSGSSFLGEIFNRRDDVFYLYEPLHPLSALSKILSNYRYEENVIELISNFSNCQFYAYQDYFDFITYPSLSNPHFRLMSKVLSSPPFCDKHMLSNSTEEEYKTHCFKINMKILKKSCKSKNTFVFKELSHRLNLKTLNRYFDGDSFQYISLVRDPRAIIWSMYKNKWIGKPFSFAVSIDHAVVRVCSLFRSNYITILNENMTMNPQDFVAVRYEDLVSDPQSIVSALFKFAHLRTEQEELDWVIDNTIGQLDNRDTSYSVFMKNASYSLNSWRVNLKFSIALQVQNMCGDVMEKYGYVLYDRDFKMKDLSTPSFVPGSSLNNLMTIV